MDKATEIYMDLASFRSKNEMMSIWRGFVDEMADLIFDDPQRDNIFQHQLWDKIMEHNCKMYDCMSKSCGGTYEEYSRNTGRCENTDM